MRVCVAVMVSAVLGLLLPQAAAADFVHVVSPGESLSSIAAADGLSVGQLAAANGLSPYAQLVAGTGVQIPAQSGAGPAPAVPQSVAGDGDGDGDDLAPAGPASPAPAAAAATSAPGGDGDNDSDDVAQGGVVSSASGQPAAGFGSYVVQPGDTLSAIAARAGMSVADLAATNGLDPAAPLLSGSVLRLGGGGGGSASSAQLATASAAGQPVGAAAEGSPVAPPYPTPQTVAPSQVGSIAAANGVPPSLADAIAYQESGFNNAAVSTADARGVMQILPGTWDWIQRTLVAGAPPLAPASATDNIRGGVLLLRSLLNSTGGNPALAAAGYYQGLPSVQQNGIYPSTQQYVNNVMALAQRFGGG